MNTPLRIAFATAVLALLAGCGAKGPLFLPTKDAPVEVPATPVEAPATAPAEQPATAPTTPETAPVTPPSTPDARR